jgi:UDP-glucose 4-epimerase
MTILVTGGAGYIGSHFVRHLERKKIDFVIADNFSTGHRELVKNKNFFELDLRDPEEIRVNLQDLDITSIVHFAGLSIVSDSQKMEKEYYENNVLASMNLAKFALEKKIRKFIYSSSAAVYGIPEDIPVKENHPTRPINNYGKNKLEVENLLKNLSMEFPLDVVCLRYFNAAGADDNGDLGEEHNPETHLIPNVINSALNSYEFTVNGDTYKTNDGTCIRDFVHVNDLASAHLLSLNFLDINKGFHIFNLGSERGFSVMEVINECQKLMKTKIKFKIGKKREGDPDILIADNKKSVSRLNWKLEKNTLRAIISSAIDYHKNAL